MQALKIALFGVASAIGYGVLHDMVTANLCVEYFTIAHPPVFPTVNPFLLALGWGVIATWWVGLPLGLAASAAARAGKNRKLTLADIRPMVFVLLGVMAASALAAGVLSAFLVAHHRMDVPGGWAPYIPPEKWVAFSADAGAHLASYAVGALGGIALTVRIVWLRIWPKA